MMNVIEESRAVLSTHARSFRWAAFFLPRECRDDAAVIYAFCRLVDDIVDESDCAETATAQLDAVERELNGDDPRPLIRGFLDVSARREIDPMFAEQLIEGIRTDLDRVRFSDIEDLLRYSYRVAGTVGLMMSAILGIQERTAYAHAIDLGVAMQITNVCRDVLEDAEIDRVYLPEEMLLTCGLSSEELQQGKAKPGQISSVVRSLLKTADRYYASADQGMRFIPARSRFAILVASRLYRSIGLKLARAGGDPMTGRTIVGPLEKIRWVGSALSAFFRLRHNASNGHNPDLHLPLRGLPGANDVGAE